jgi:hypothetical protein
MFSTGTSAIMKVKRSLNCGSGSRSSLFRLCWLLSWSGSWLLCCLFILGCLCCFAFSTIGRCPEGKVVPEQLHYQRAVAVRFLRQRVELGDGVVKGLLGKMTRTIGRVQNLVVENGKVESETQTDWVSWGQFGLSYVGGTLEACQRGSLR